jgi:hypothetical protein
MSVKNLGEFHEGWRLNLKVLAGKKPCTYCEASDEIGKVGSLS